MQGTNFSQTQQFITQNILIATCFALLSHHQAFQRRDAMYANKCKIQIPNTSPIIKLLIHQKGYADITMTVSNNAA
jgi:hypothetical protein